MGKIPNYFKEDYVGGYDTWLEPFKRGYVVKYL